MAGAAAWLRFLGPSPERIAVQTAPARTVGDPEADTEEGREAMRPGLVRLGGVTSMLVEPPDPRYAFTAAGGVLLDGGFGAYPGEPC